MCIVSMSICKLNTYPAKNFANFAFEEGTDYNSSILVLKWKHNTNTTIGGLDRTSFMRISNQTLKQFMKYQKTPSTRSLCFRWFWKRMVILELNHEPDHLFSLILNMTFTWWYSECLLFIWILDNNVRKCDCPICNIEIVVHT